jgi:uncharacterized protein (TIGR03067 family)
MYCVLTAAALLASVTSGWDSGPMPADGKWQAIEAELNGKPFPPEAAKGIQLTIDGDKYVVTTNEGEDRGTVRYVPDEKPSALDITGTDGPNKGKTFLAIYKVVGDKLTVCYDLSGKSRPKEFKTTPKSMLFLATYRKQKP